MKVRIRKFPHQVIDVGPAEYVDLKRQGLLVEDEPAAPAQHQPRRAPAPAADKEEN